MKIKTSVYDIKNKENTLSTHKKKEKAHDAYVCKYEYSKHFCTSTFKYAYAAQETTISQIKERFEVV